MRLGRSLREHGCPCASCSGATTSGRVRARSLRRSQHDGPDPGAPGRGGRLPALHRGRAGVAGPRAAPPPVRRPVGGARQRDWLVQAGLGDVAVRELLAVIAALAVLRMPCRPTPSSAGSLPALAAGAFAGSFPLGLVPAPARRPPGRRDGRLAPHDRGAAHPHRVAGPVDPAGPVRGRATGTGGAAPGVRGGPAGVAALHRLRPHPRRAQGSGSPTPPPTPSARRCSSPTRSAAPTSTAASRR